MNKCFTFTFLFLALLFSFSTVLVRNTWLEYCGWYQLTVFNTKAVLQKCCNMPTPFPHRGNLSPRAIPKRRVMLITGERVNIQKHLCNFLMLFILTNLAIHAIMSNE